MWTTSPRGSKKNLLSTNCTHIQTSAEKSIDQSNSTINGHWNVFGRLFTLNFTVSTKMRQVNNFHSTHTNTPNDHRHRHLLIHSLLITYAPLSIAQFSVRSYQKIVPFYWHYSLRCNWLFGIIDTLKRIVLLTWISGVGFRSRKCSNGSESIGNHQNDKFGNDYLRLV